MEWSQRTPAKPLCFSSEMRPGQGQAASGGRAGTTTPTQCSSPRPEPWGCGSGWGGQCPPPPPHGPGQGVQEALRGLRMGAALWPLCPPAPWSQTLLSAAQGSVVWGDGVRRDSSAPPSSVQLCSRPLRSPDGRLLDMPTRGRRVGSAGGGGGPGSPGDVPEWRGQAGQMEGPGTAVAADELPAVPAHGALVLVLLTQSGDRHPLRDRDGRPPGQTAPRAASPRGTQVPSLLPAWNSALPACSPGLREAPLSETVAPNTSWVHPPREGLSLGEPGVSWVPVLHAAVRLQPTPHSPFLTGQRRGRPSSVPPTPCLCPLCLRPSLEGAYCTQLDATSFRSPPG